MTITVGIVGSAGAYGIWLRQFFTEVMDCRVLGNDPQQADSASVAELLTAADVLLFSTPIRQTPAIVAEFVAQAGAHAAQQLWLDITSIKEPAVAAMLQGPAEVVGLHPMCAAPTTRTLRDRVLVVCEARLNRWRDWFGHMLHALDAQTVYSTAAEHDRVMALVQGLVHASHLAQAQVIGNQPEGLQQLAALMPFRSPSFTLDMTVVARILTSNPGIYEDIQFLNPHVPAVLEQVADAMQRMAQQVRSGDVASRQHWREQNLTAPRQQLGLCELQCGNARFEQLAYLLSDLDEPNVVVMHLPHDAPGQLRELLGAFAAAGVNLQSLHSSRDRQGRVHFRLGLDRAIQAPEVQAALTELAQTGTAIRTG